MKKELQRKLSFVLFVMAVFFAGMSLTVFQSYIWMACIAGVLLLAASTFFVLNQKEESASPTEKTTELLLADRIAELMRGNEKAEKGVYIAVKKQHEAMESGMAALEEKIAELIKAQENSVKTLVMYNKENAKQMALSEKEELGRLRDALNQVPQDGAIGSLSQVTDAVREMSHRLYEEIHETGEAMLSELGTTVDCLDEMKELLKSASERTPMNASVSSEPVVKEAAFMEDELPEEEAFVPEEVFEEEPVVEADPNQMLSADDIAALFAQAEAEEISEPEPEPIAEADPNQMLSADDIAALFAAANGAGTESEPEIVPEDEPAEEKPEDAFASSGVDLSDPNKTLSADDIAALFASMGN